MSSTLAIITLFFPLFFVLLVWASVTAWRILKDEPAPLVLSDGEPEARANMRYQGRPMRVGAREIRDDLRYHARRSTAVTYDSSAPDHAFPEAWWDDICARCN